MNIRRIRYNESCNQNDFPAFFFKDKKITIVSVSVVINCVQAKYLIKACKKVGSTEEKRQQMQVIKKTSKINIDIHDCENLIV